MSYTPKNQFGFVESDCPAGQVKDLLFYNCTDPCAQGLAPTAGLCPEDYQGGGLPAVPSFPFPGDQPPGGVTDCPPGEFMNPFTNQCAKIPTLPSVPPPPPSPPLDAKQLAVTAQPAKAGTDPLLIVGAIALAGLIVWSWRK